MTAYRCIATIVLSVGLCFLSAVAEGGNNFSNVETAPARVPIPEASLASVDRYLLEALQAADEYVRKQALRSAQGVLDAMGLNKSRNPGGDKLPGESAEWLVQTESDLGQFEDQTRRELRESLMHKVWASPYGAIPENGLNVLEVISDALQLLREMLRLGDGDADALNGIRASYWNTLMSHRQAMGLENTFFGGPEGLLVFDQRVKQGKGGEVEIYQLTGTEDQILRWALSPVEKVPDGLLNAGSLTVDLSREDAAWLLILEGEAVSEYLVEHHQWLAAIDKEVRLVLREGGDYAAALQNIPSEWFEPDRRIPYILGVRSDKKQARLHLVQVATKRLIGSWSLSALDGQNSAAFKGLIKRILATANPRQQPGMPNRAGLPRQ